MAVLVRPSTELPKPSRAVSKTLRKVGLLGSYSASLKSCPWTDPSWELWGHASSRGYYARELDRYFDLHRKECWTRGGKKGATYPEWLSKNTVPIFMQDRYAEVPASIRYPKERILLEYGGLRRYFKNHLAWMIALAFSEGVSTIAIFGINYGHFSEYYQQRASAEYWLGRAEERGITILLPDECTLLQEPAGLYGYESHDENGKLVQAYREKVFKNGDSIRPIVPGEKVEKMAIPDEHRAQAAIEDAERPDWAKAHMPKETS